MLKKVFIWGIALFGMTAISSNVSASAASDVYSVATVAESLEGNCQGNLIRVYMNGEKNPVYGKVANVTDNGDGTVNIHIDSFKIGSMPGSITVDAMDITVPASGGNFSQTCESAVKLKIGILPLSYDALVEGEITGNYLKFTVTVNTQYSGSLFEAIVTFEGTK